MDNLNGFPATYQSPYQSTYQSTYQPNWYYQPTTTTPVYQTRWQSPTAVQQYSQPQNNQPVNNGMVWVQGEAGAKAYVLPNGTTLPLWDSEAQTIYIKSVDMSGKPTMTILDYVDRNAPSESKDNSVEYVTLEQFNKMNDENKEVIEKLTSQLSDMRQKLSDFKPFASNNNRKGNNNG